MSEPREPEPDVDSDGLPEYAALLAARHAAHRLELERLLAELCGGKPWRVLDLACGDGFYAAAFDRLLGPRGTVTAVDLSVPFLDWSRQRVEEDRGPNHRVEFVRADALALPFPEESFDLAWCAQSLISLPDPQAALRELRRVTRPGGWVAVLENDRLHEMQLPWPVPLELALRRAERTSDNPQAAGDVPYAGRFLGEMLAQAGLKPIRRITLAIDRMPPFSTADDAFLKAYFHALLASAETFLDATRFTELQQLTDPGSREYLPRRPGFWTTWTDIVFLAERPSD